MDRTDYRVRAWGPRHHHDGCGNGTTALAAMANRLLLRKYLRPKISPLARTAASTSPIELTIVCVGSGRMASSARLPGTERMALARWWLAIRAQLDEPIGLALGPDGSLYIAIGSSARAPRGPDAASGSAGDIIIPSEDASEIYILAVRAGICRH